MLMPIRPIVYLYSAVAMGVVNLRFNQKQIWITLFTIVGLQFCLSAKVHSQLGKMEFTAIPSPIEIAISGVDAWEIYAVGPIDSGAPQRFIELIENENIPAASTVYFHSSGGNLDAGLALGRIIRENGFWTRIGQQPRNYRQQNESGECYSACALAFLGGIFRFHEGDSRYGVHRFYSTNYNDGEVAQIISAAIVAYIREMGADISLFSLMSSASSDDIRLVSKDVLLELNIVNNGYLPARWTFDSVPQGIYLKGEQATRDGLQKMIFLCNKGKVKFIPMFNIDGVGVNYWNRIFLLIDDQQYELQSSQMERHDNYLAFNIIRRMFVARKTGYIVYMPKKNMNFEHVMEFNEGARKKFKDLALSCLKN